MKRFNYKISGFIILIALLILVSLFQLVFAGDQIKSNEFFVGSYTGSLSSSTDFPFAMYLGEDLTGVSDPVKHAAFSISGVYTGSGSLQLQIDSDAATSKTFTLPNTAQPKDFYLVYKDDVGKLKHASAGTYNHALNVIPSGITISNFGAKLNTTHQFAPSSCIDGQPINQKIKTSEFFVTSYNNAINSNVILPFSVYIGDDISEITNAVKSFYFSVSGVYTGGGNVSMLISDDGSGTSTIFYLPSVSSPTNFSFSYKDIDGKVNPTSAGSYNYNLNLGVSGPTISNLAVKAIMTHRYKPVSCGVGYPPYGDLISAVYDSTANADGPAYNSIMWKGHLGGASMDQGQVKFQIAAADSSSGPWNYTGGNTCGSSDWYEASQGTAVELLCHPQVNNKRYFRYKIRICADDCLVGGANTPQVDDIIVNWSP
jgi:hypothetical protein